MKLICIVQCCELVYEKVMFMKKLFIGYLSGSQSVVQGNQGGALLIPKMWFGVPRRGSLKVYSLTHTHARTHTRTHALTQKGSLLWFYKPGLWDLQYILGHSAILVVVVGCQGDTTTNAFPNQTMSSTCRTTPQTQ